MRSTMQWCKRNRYSVTVGFEYKTILSIDNEDAAMAELVDARDLKSRFPERSTGSIPVGGRKKSSDRRIVTAFLLK